jgi:uncharacterized protein (UPF0335 family)
MSEIGDNSGAMNGAHLRAFIERVEKLEEEKRVIADDVKSVYDEIKSAGFDQKIIRKIVAARRKAAAAREEENELLRLYAEAINQPDLFG